MSLVPLGPYLAVCWPRVALSLLGREGRCPDAWKLLETWPPLRLGRHLTGTRKLGYSVSAAGIGFTTTPYSGAGHVVRTRAAHVSGTELASSAAWMTLTPMLSSTGSAVICVMEIQTRGCNVSVARTGSSIAPCAAAGHAVRTCANHAESSTTSALTATL
jgi:hypothetical protein